MPLQSHPSWLYNINYDIKFWKSRVKNPIENSKTQINSTLFREVDDDVKEQYNAVHRKNESEPVFIKKPGKQPVKKMFQPDRTGAAAEMKFDNETEHKTKVYENRYNKLFRKFEYNKVLTMTLAYNIRFVHI